jgi:D-lactate dehydrogenase (cytochrome)
MISQATLGLRGLAERFGEAFLISQAAREQHAGPALAPGRTCTGEHGIGISKQGGLMAERGGDGVALMATINNALEQLAILDPSEIFASKRLVQ